YIFIASPIIKNGGWCDLILLTTSPNASVSSIVGTDNTVGRTEINPDVSLHVADFLRVTVPLRSRTPDLMMIGSSICSTNSSSSEWNSPTLIGVAATRG